MNRMKKTMKRSKTNRKKYSKTRKASKNMELCTCSPDVGDCPKCNKKCYVI